MTHALIETLFLAIGAASLASIIHDMRRTL